MNILHLLSQRPDSTGSGIYIQAMLREAAAHGHRNFLVAGIQSDWPVQLDAIEPDRCRFVSFGGGDLAYPIVGMSDVMPYDSRRFRDLSEDDLQRYEAAFTRQIQAALAVFQPDIIHSHHLWIVSALIRRLCPHTPIVTTCHGSDLRQFRSCAHLRERVLDGCRGLNAVMALSRSQKEDIVDLYGLPPDMVAVVGAGYNSELFVQSTSTEPNPVQIVYAGKLSRAKGVPWLLRALSAIDRPNWPLHVVGGGSGPEKAECLELAGRLGSRATVHGAVPQDRLAEIMRKAHLFVLPSFFEGLPLVVLEALASGCRIVATDLSGVSELLGGMHTDIIELVPTPRLRDVDQPVEEDQAGFESNLSKALHQQINRARLQPHIDLSAIAAQMAAYSWQGIFEKVQAVYVKVDTSAHS
jgi:glycosyltransferase involved in cell wall biosynthesis